MSFASILPFVGPALSIGSSLLGGSTQAAGQQAEAQAKASAATMQARLSFLQQNAELNKGVEQEQLMRYNARNLLSSQRAGYAAEGVRLEGTPLLAMANTLTQSSRDIMLANNQNVSTNLSKDSKQK